MSLHTYVVGFRPPDDRWHQMKAVYDAATAAGVPVPYEVEAFFEGTASAPHGITVAIPEATTAWQDDSTEGIDIDVRALPPEVHIIRFVNSF